MDAVIVDYGMGNLRSVQKAVEFIGLRAEISADTDKIYNASRLILPGVGTFDRAMTALKGEKAQAILGIIKRGTPFMGICLGMQLLFDQSEENGLWEGLGILRGRVTRFKGDGKIPQIGWNNIIPIKPVFCESAYTYFVHSYYAPITAATESICTYSNTEFAASVAQNNVFGTQFHPEKSGAAGLKIFAKFFKV